MDLVGFDTLSLLFDLDHAVATIASKALPRERRERSGGISHLYGNFPLLSATLHLPPSGMFSPAALVLTASLPRLICGENSRPVGTRLAAEAVTDLCGRFAALAGIQLDPSSGRVCRADFCATFAPFLSSQELIARLAQVDLPRRDRAAMGNGASFYSNAAKETVYDKFGEIDRSIKRLTRRASDDPNVARHLAALLRAERRLACGALRVECRINGSRAIANRLRLPIASPELVLTTTNAARVVDSFLAQLRPRLVSASAPAAARSLSRDLGSIRGQRAFALLALADLSGSIEVAAAALGIPATGAERLASAARTAGIGSIDVRGRSEELALALPAVSVEGTDRFERRLLRTWRRTSAASSSSSSLSWAA